MPSATDRRILPSSSAAPNSEIVPEPSRQSDEQKSLRPVVAGTIALAWMLAEGTARALKAVGKFAVYLLFSSWIAAVDLKSHGIRASTANFVVDKIHCMLWMAAALYFATLLATGLSIKIPACVLVWSYGSVHFSFVTPAAKEIKELAARVLGKLKSKFNERYTQILSIGDKSVQLPDTTTSSSQKPQLPPIRVGR